MERMKPCASCGVHVREGTCACPHCGSSACRSGVSKAGVLLGLVLVAGCTKVETDEPQAEYGVAMIDVDQDGYSSEVDCNDDDATIHPEAVETPGDTVDSNCDGYDDT